MVNAAHFGVESCGGSGAAIAHEWCTLQELQGGCHTKDGMDRHGGHLAMHEDDAAPTQRCTHSLCTRLLAAAGLAHRLYSPGTDMFKNLIVHMGLWTPEDTSTVCNQRSGQTPSTITIKAAALGPVQHKLKTYQVPYMVVLKNSTPP